MMAEWVYCSNECKRMRWCSLEQAWHDTRAADYTTSFHGEYECPDCGTACGPGMVTNAPDDESPKWELAHVAEYLQSFPRDDADDYGVAGVYLGLVDMDGMLTPAGTALLALLEIESCKRRIEAAGMWATSSTIPNGRVALMHTHQTPRRTHTIEFVGGVRGWRAAAEYAEAHAQEAGK